MHHACHALQGEIALQNVCYVLLGFVLLAMASNMLWERYPP